jgi:hypothetical protein
MPRHSHEVFDNKGSKRRLLGWLTGEPARSSANGSAGSPARLQAEYPAPSPAPLQAETHVETQASPQETSHAGLHAGPHASGSARLPPLTTYKIGDKTRVANGKAEWSQEDFGLSFLTWFEDTYPDDWGTWVWFPDVRKHYFPRFKAATGARYLQLGSLIRGLGAVTHTRPMQYVDATARRRSTTEYWMGPFS